MLKKFFISMLGTIAGFWISMIIAVFVIFAIIGAVVSSGSSNSKPSIESNSILYLNLSGDMPERYQPTDVWQMLKNEGDSSDALIDILRSIRSAKNDSKIKGIYINASSGLAGFASREEIVEALRDFKESGKWIYAYGDMYSQGDYLLSSVADSLFLNPIGSVDVHGIASSIPFFKGLLDKVGVKMQIVRVGTFKSAVEPFMTTEMSPASRLQTQVMIDSIWDYVKTTVADARGIKTAEVDVWADTLMGLAGARYALDQKAVSALRYRRAVEKMLRGTLDIKDKDELPLVTPTDYTASLDSYSKDKDHIAVLFACGDIVDSGDGGIVGETMVPEIISLADDDHVKALVLRVNSGGGSAFASEQIWEALEYFKSKDKPFYVSMGDYAASGGYYISCGADKIFADHTTVTGSIGVFGMMPDFSELATDKLGLHFANVETNKNASFPSLYTSLSKEQYDALQRNVDNIYDLFTSRVAEGRDISQDSVKVIAEGRVWTGGAALRIGLVDEIGSLDKAVSAIAEAADIDADHVVMYPDVEDNFLSKVLAQAKGNIKIGDVTLDSRYMYLARFVDRLRTMNRVQARMPEIMFE